jgi:all-trans-retinol 13,14-reductase
MAKEGMNVCVLEKNRQYGGSLQIFSRDKAIFDTGVHYVGGLDEGQNLNRYFKYFGLMDKLKLRKMDLDGYDHITFEGNDKVYKHAQGYENFVEVLAADFPHQREQLKTYVQTCNDICNSFPLYNLAEGKKDFNDDWYRTISAKDYINKLFTDPLLAKIIGANNMLYCGNDYTPFFVHAAVVNSYMQSAYRCVDGSSQIAKYMVDGIKALGGTVLNYHEVIGFDISGEEVKSVKMRDGKSLETKWVISAIDFKRLMQIIDESHFRKAYRNRIQNLENTPSLFLLSTVFHPKSVKRMDYNVYHYINTNIWDSAKHMESDWPRGFGIFPTYNSKNPDYSENAVMMAYMRYDEVQQWKDSFATIPNHATSRGEDYEEFKLRKGTLLLQKVAEKYPDLASSVKSFTCATPLTYRDYIGSTDGTSYGFAKDYRLPMSSFFTSRTKIKNLLLTGQDLNLHGVLGVTISAVATCSEIFGHPYLINKIKAAS